MSVHNAVLEKFKRQYLQIVAFKGLSWPAREDVRSIYAQTWLYNNLFDKNTQRFLPPERYQIRVLKQLMKTIEDAMIDPDEDEISDDLTSGLAALMSQKQPNEASAVQLPSYVTYSFNRGTDSVATVTILERPALLTSSGSTGFRTWESGLHLAKYLTTSGDGLVRGMRVLELGAGAGLVSILCAQWLGAQNVTATDGDDSVIEELQTNLYLNGLDHSDRIYAKSLKWGRALEDDEGGESPIFDLVLGADITYDPRPLPALVASFRELFLLNSKVQIILGVAIRNQDTFSVFRTSCERSNMAIVDIEFATVPSSQQEGPFYSTECPFRIVRIVQTGVIRDPFA